MPHDPDPVRSAFLACIPQLLVVSFNRRIETGLLRTSPSILSWGEVDACHARPESEKPYEAVPTWTKDIPRLDETLITPSSEGTMSNSFKDEDADEAFKSKNI